jgi:hypothetical protein
MSAIVDDFDMDAAWVRRAQGDLPALMEALAVRLESALPDRVDLDRRRDGLFSRTSHVHAIVLRGDSAEFRLVFERGALTATKAKAVRGVVISTAQQTFPQWLSEVRAEIRSLATNLGSASDSMGGFL